MGWNDRLRALGCPTRIVVKDMVATGNNTAGWTDISGRVTEFRPRAYRLEEVEDFTLFKLIFG